jgi:hypothetical protein
MMNKNDLIPFLINARKNTYAGNAGEVTALLVGSRQFEFTEGELLYRDIFNIGNNKFAGLETIYYKNKPVWSMSYYGNFESLSEEEVDTILRKALVEKWDKVRLWNDVKYKIDEYDYSNNGSGDIDELDGSEKLEKNGETVYYFYYAGAFMG